MSSGFRCELAIRRLREKGFQPFDAKDSLGWAAHLHHHRRMQIHRLTVADAFASLKSGREGLSDAEAQRRLAEFGKNEVEEVAHEALLLTFAREFVHFFALILWIAAGLAFFAEWRETGRGWRRSGPRSSA